MSRNSDPNLGDMPVRRAPGRRSKAEGAAIDERILLAAWDAFVALGYEAANMEMIADQAGVTRMTVYSRHPNKIALLRATIDHRVKRWSEAGRRPDWLRGRTLEERLTNYGQQVLLWSANEEVVATRRFVEGTSGEAALAAQELDRTIRNPVTIEVAEEIDRYCEELGVPCGDPREIALLFLGMLEAIWRSAPSAPPESYLERVEKAVAILVGGRAHW